MVYKHTHMIHNNKIANSLLNSPFFYNCEWIRGLWFKNPTKTTLSTQSTESDSPLVVTKIVMVRMKRILWHLCNKISHVTLHSSYSDTRYTHTHIYKAICARNQPTTSWAAALASIKLIRSLCCFEHVRANEIYCPGKRHKARRDDDDTRYGSFTFVNARRTRYNIVCICVL